MLVHTDPDAQLSLAARTTPHVTELTVADAGPGLGPADAASVFDRFYRGDQSRGRRRDGSGLGLSIAKSIVEAHGDTIPLDTTPTRDAASWSRCPTSTWLPTPSRPAPSPP